MFSALCLVFTWIYTYAGIALCFQCAHIVLFTCSFYRAGRHQDRNGFTISISSCLMFMCLEQNFHSNNSLGKFEQNLPWMITDGGITVRRGYKATLHIVFSFHGHGNVGRLVLVGNCVRPPAYIYCYQLPWNSQVVAHTHTHTHTAPWTWAAQGCWRTDESDGFFWRGLPHTAFFCECIVMFFYTWCYNVSVFFAVPTVLPCGAAELCGGAKMSVNVDYTMNFGVVFLS